MPVLGLAGFHWRKTGKLQVRFHRNIAASSLAADCNVPQRPPAELENPVHDWKNESVETKQPNHRLEVLHLFRWSTHTLVCVVDHTLFLVSDPPNLVDWPSIHLDNVGLLIRYLLVYDCITCWIYGRYCLLQLDGFIDKPTNIAVDPWGNAETISIYR